MGRGSAVGGKWLATGLCLAAALCGRPAPAGERDRLELRGQIFTAEQKPLPGRGMAVVNLWGAVTPFHRSTQAMGGKFKFGNLLPGIYSLGVSVRGVETRQTVEVTRSLADSKGRVMVRVVFGEPEARSRRGTISVRELSIPEAARSEYRRALKELSRRRTEAAIARLEKALEIAPNFVEALNHLGTIYYHKREFARAEGYFRRALELDGNAYEPLVNLGGTLLELDRYTEALPFNLNATMARPDDALAHAQMGMNLFALGHHDNAINYLKQAKKLDPSHFSNPQLLLAEIYLRKGDRPAALAELEEFVKLHPDNALARRMKEALALQK